MAECAGCSRTAAPEMGVDRDSNGEAGTVRRRDESVGTRSSGLRLSISDNGPGFPAHLLARAFEPYVTSKSKGTGLGLATVKKIVDEHGARIEIRNDVRDDGTVSGAQISILFFQLADDAAPRIG